MFSPSSDPNFIVSFHSVACNATSSDVGVLNNNGMMYQTNMSQQATGNGAVLAHTNGMMNMGYASQQQQQQSQSMSQSLPQHPEVRLKRLAFFDEIAILLKPTTLLPSSNTQRMQESTHYFNLTPQQATDIANNRCDPFFSPVVL